MLAALLCSIRLPFHTGFFLPLTRHPTLWMGQIDKDTLLQQPVYSESRLELSHLAVSYSKEAQKFLLQEQVNF